MDSQAVAEIALRGPVCPRSRCTGLAFRSQAGLSWANLVPQDVAPGCFPSNLILPSLPLHTHCLTLATLSILLVLQSIFCLLRMGLTRCLLCREHSLPHTDPARLRSPSPKRALDPPLCVWLSGFPLPWHYQHFSMRLCTCLCATVLFLLLEAFPGPSQLLQASAGAFPLSPDTTALLPHRFILPPTLAALHN